MAKIKIYDEKLHLSGVQDAPSSGGGKYIFDLAQTLTGENQLDFSSEEGQALFEHVVQGDECFCNFTELIEGNNPRRHFPMSPITAHYQLTDSGEPSEFSAVCMNFTLGGTYDNILWICEL